MEPIGNFFQDFVKEQSRSELKTKKVFQKLATLLAGNS